MKENNKSKSQKLVWIIGSSRATGSRVYKYTYILPRTSVFRFKECHKSNSTRRVPHHTTRHHRIFSTANQVTLADQRQRKSQPPTPQRTILVITTAASLFASI